MIDVTLDRATYDKAQQLLSKAPKEVQRAASAAINRGLTKLKTHASKTVRAEYVIKAADVKSAMSTHKASAGNLQGILNITGQKIPLKKFKISGGRSGPLKVKVEKKKPLHTAKGLFQVKGKSYYMQRRTRARLPIFTPYGPAVPEMAGKDVISSEIMSFADEYVAQRFAHEIDYRLGRLGL